MNRLWLFITVSIFFLSPAQAIDETVDPIAQEIFTDVMSPFCPGLVLRDCPSEKATELKRSIRNRLKQGESKDAIERSLYSQFGDSLRALPPLSGFGIFAWGFPLVVFIGGVLVILLRTGSKSLQGSDDQEI